MKKYCKDVDISDHSLISKAAYDCLQDKYSRNDTMRLFPILVAYDAIKCIAFIIVMVSVLCTGL